MTEREQTDPPETPDPPTDDELDVEGPNESTQPSSDPPGGEGS